MGSTIHEPSKKRLVEMGAVGHPQVHQCTFDVKKMASGCMKECHPTAPQMVDTDRPLEAKSISGSMACFNTIADNPAPACQGRTVLQ